MLRHALLMVFLTVAGSAWSQHVSLYWYNLQSVAPLDLTEGKMALTRIKQVVNDSLASFTDRGDYFQIATKTPIDWVAFQDAMEAAGYYIADVTQRDTHHDSYVKMGLAYQQAHYLLDHPEVLATWSTQVVVTQTEFDILTESERQVFISHPQLFLIKD